MVNFLVLNLLLGITLAVTIFENKIAIPIRKPSKTITYLFLILSVIGIASSFPYLLTTQPFLSKYLLIVFDLLIAGHFLFLSFNQKFWNQVLFFTISLGIIFYHTFRSSMLSQDLFVLFALVWLGPFLLKKGILTYRRTLVILGVWILYNMIFLFFHSTTNHIFQSTQKLRIPFSVIVGNSYLGIVDVIIPNILVSLLKVVKLQFAAVFIFVFANLVIGILAFQLNAFTVFPISAVWILLAIPLVFFDQRLQRIQAKV